MRVMFSHEAFELAQLALATSEEVGYDRGVACALRTLAAANVSNCLPTAYKNAVRAIDILTEIGDYYNACTAYPVLFIYYFNTGQHRLALSAVQRCIELARECGNEYAESLGHYNLGFYYRMKEDWDLAEKSLKFAAETSLKAENFPTYGLAMTELATMFSQSKTASFDYARLVDVSETIRDLPGTPGYAECLRAKVMYLFATADRAGGVRAYREARLHSKSTMNQREYLRTLQVTGNFQQFSGQLLRARRTFLAELRILREVGLKIGEAEVLTHLAAIERELGMFETANEHLAQLLMVKSGLHCEDAEARHRELEILHQTEEFATQAQESKRQAEALAAVNQQLHAALERQTELQRELMRLASTDELTGAVNRRQIVNDGILEMERYRHTGSPFAVTVIDVDHFKGINDTFGHATGDEVLRRLTKCCQALLRKFDVFGRLGGEEFCIVHHDTDIQGATMAVERLMGAIEMIFVADILPDRPFTVSIGVAEVHEGDGSFYDVLHQADMALYEAKRSGRNTYRTVQSRVLEAA